MFSGSRNGYAVQYFKEIEIKGSKKCICRSVLWIQLAPCVECLLCLTENILQGLTCVKLAVKILGITTGGVGIYTSFYTRIRELFWVLVGVGLVKVGNKRIMR